MQMLQNQWAFKGFYVLLSGIIPFLAPCFPDYLPSQQLSMFKSAFIEFLSTGSYFAESPVLQCTQKAKYVTLTPKKHLKQSAKHT